MMNCDVAPSAFLETNDMDYARLRSRREQINARMERTNMSRRIKVSQVSSDLCGGGTVNKGGVPHTGFNGGKKSEKFFNQEFLD